MAAGTCAYAKAGTRVLAFATPRGKSIPELLTNQLRWARTNLVHATVQIETLLCPLSLSVTRRVHSLVLEQAVAGHVLPLRFDKLQAATRRMRQAVDDMVQHLWPFFEVNLEGEEDEVVAVELDLHLVPSMWTKVVSPAMFRDVDDRVVESECVVDDALALSLRESLVV